MLCFSVTLIILLKYEVCVLYIRCTVYTLKVDIFAQFVLMSFKQHFLCRFSYILSALVCRKVQILIFNYLVSQSGKPKNIFPLSPRYLTKIKILEIKIIFLKMGQVISKGIQHGQHVT